MMFSNQASEILYHLELQRCFFLSGINLPDLRADPVSYGINEITSIRYQHIVYLRERTTLKREMPYLITLCSSGKSVQNKGTFLEMEITWRGRRKRCGTQSSEV